MAGEEITHINPIEAKASKVKAELDAVWNSEITAENIGSYSDYCLNKVVDIVTRVTEEKFPGMKITPKEEDQALQELGLDVTTTLDNLEIALEQKRSQIDEIFQFVTNADQGDILLVAPGEGNINHSNGEADKREINRKLIPRIETIVYILVHDLNIPLEEIKILRGIVSINIFRKAPYVRIEANGKIIYACNESNNASYIFEKSKLPEGIDIPDLDRMSKEQLAEIIRTNPQDHFFVAYLHNWRDEIIQILSGNKLDKKRDLDPRVLIPINDKNSPDLGYAILDGEKWGNALTIQRNERINQDRFEKISKGLQTKPILVRGKTWAAYRVLDILERDIKRGVPIAEKTGDWRGYVTIGDKHYGAVLSLSIKLEVSRAYVSKLLAKYNIPSIHINTGKVVNAYPYEDTLNALRNSPPQNRTKGKVENI